MAATIKPSEALARDPEFFNKRPADVNWTLEVHTEEGVKNFVGVDWRCYGRFGEVGNVVVCDKDGKPAFDRPFYQEVRAINAIAYGRDPINDEVRIAVVKEERPHADDPENPDSEEAVMFGQVPMGFMEKLVGKDASKEWEDAESATVREVGQETGHKVVKSISRPPCPWHTASPSFTKSWVDLVFIEVDLDIIARLKLERGELIYKAEFIPVRTLIERIKQGKDEDGALYRGATSNSLWMIFFACFPELFVSAIVSSSE